MSQNDYSSIVDPASTSGNIINQTIDNWQSALHSNHSGSSLPFYAEEGMIWVQIVSSTQHILNYYNGTNSIALATINPVTLSVVFPNVVEKTSDTGAAKLPVGTTAEQPAAESGHARVNSSTNEALVAVGSSYFEITNDRKGVATTDVDAMAVTFSRPVLALTDKMTFQVRSFGDNTVTNPTISIDGLAPVTIVKNGNQPLSAGDTGSSGNVMILQYSSENDNIELLNPVSSTVADERVFVDFTASRLYDVNYTNSTGRSIIIWIETGFSTGAELIITVDGISITSKRVTNATAQNYSEQILIPNNSTYSASCGVAINKWLELR